MHLQTFTNNHFHYLITVQIGWIPAPFARRMKWCTCVKSSTSSLTQVPIRTNASIGSETVLKAITLQQNKKLDFTSRLPIKFLWRRDQAHQFPRRLRWKQLHFSRIKGYIVRNVFPFNFYDLRDLTCWTCLMNLSQCNAMSFNAAFLRT
jgi:hypothetical protein